MTDTKVDKISDEERLLAAMAYGEASASNDADLPPELDTTFS